MLALCSKEVLPFGVSFIQSQIADAAIDETRMNYFTVCEFQLCGGSYKVFSTHALLSYIWKPLKGIFQFSVSQ